MNCESYYLTNVAGVTYQLARCQREAGHRPQTWHRHFFDDGSTLEWSFSPEERAAWKKKFGKGS